GDPGLPGCPLIGLVSSPVGRFYHSHADQQRMAGIYKAQFALGKFFSRHVHLVGDSGKYIAVDIQRVILWSQVEAPEHILNLNWGKPAVYKHRFACSHVQAAWKIVIDTREVYEQDATGLQNSHRVVKSGL